MRSTERIAMCIRWSIVGCGVLALAACRKAGSTGDGARVVIDSGPSPLSSRPIPTADSPYDAALPEIRERPTCAPPLLAMSNRGLEKVTLPPEIEGAVSAPKITTGDAEVDRSIDAILRAPIQDRIDLLHDEVREGAKSASLHGACAATFVRPELASVRCDLDTYTGGPYPNTGTDGVSLRVCGHTVRPIALQDFCGARCLDVASAAVAGQLRKRIGPSFDVVLDESRARGESLLQQFAIGPHGLTVSLTWLLPHVDGDRRIVEVAGSKIAAALDGQDEALIRILRAAWATH